MKKIFLLIAIVFSISCNQKKEEPKLKLNNFIFTNYRWRFNKPPDTSYSFVLCEYVAIKQNGVAEVMNINTDGRVEYFKDILSDTLIEKLNKLLFNRKLNKYYPYEKDNQMINDGGQYYISFTGIDSIKQESIFEPYRKSNVLDSIREFIDYFVHNKSLHTTKPFSTDSITSYLKYYSRKINPLPIIKYVNPPEINMKKFTVPKITK